MTIAKDLLKKVTLGYDSFNVKTETISKNSFEINHEFSIHCSSCCSIINSKDEFFVFFNPMVGPSVLCGKECLGSFMINGSDKNEHKIEEQQEQKPIAIRYQWFPPYKEIRPLGCYDIQIINVSFDKLKELISDKIYYTYRGCREGYIEISVASEKELDLLKIIIKEYNESFYMQYC